MRRIVFDPVAAAELASQIDYLITRHATKAARDLETRIRSFLIDHLARFPATGRKLRDRNLFEFPIPRTKLVIWYRFTDHELQIVHVWHSAQDRSNS